MLQNSFIILQRYNSRISFYLLCLKIFIYSYRVKIKWDNYFYSDFLTLSRGERFEWHILHSVFRKAGIQKVRSQIQKVKFSNFPYTSKNLCSIIFPFLFTSAAENWLQWNRNSQNFHFGVRNNRIFLNTKYARKCVCISGKIIQDCIFVQKYSV